MRVPAALIKGLTEQEIEKLEAELKRSVLAKQLRKELTSRIDQSLKAEEQADSDINFYFKEIGKRRGYRETLSLLPDVT